MAKDSPKVLITGASRGIGRAIALRLKEKNHEVIGTATSKLGIESLAKEGVIGIELDLNNKKSIETFNKLLVNEHTDISVLINNAGITRDNIVLRMTDDEWMEVMNVHLNGNFKISKTILKFMLKKRWGRIINITSRFNKILFFYTLIYFLLMHCASCNEKLSKRIKT